jgi:hypothetical protein
MYIDRWNDEPSLTSVLRTWMQSNPNWCMRPDGPDENDAQFAIFWTMPYLRQASVGEIAADVINDPKLREAIGFLASRDGQLIEDAVLHLWLPGWQAQLLTEALTLVWQTVLDENRPIWQRTEVLVGAGLGAVALIALVSLGRKS